MSTSSQVMTGPGRHHSIGGEGHQTPIEASRKNHARMGPADVVGRLLGSLLLAGLIVIGLGVAGRMLWGLGELLLQVGKFVVHRWDHWAIVAFSVVAGLYVFFFRTNSAHPQVGK